MIRLPFHLRIALLALVLATPAGAAAAAAIPGEPALPEKSPAVAPKLRLPAKAPTPELRLPPIIGDELEVLRAPAILKRVQTGVGRSLAGAEGTLPAARNLLWTPAEGGLAARFSATSPGAAAMRLAMDLAAAPAGAELVFFGSVNSGRLVGPVRVGDIADRSAPWWTPVTDGQTQTVEVFLPAGSDPMAAGLELSRVSHLVVAPVESLAKVLEKIGQSGTCNLDAKCVTNPSQGYLNARNSVARMSFVVDGSSFLCTGTLLNDATIVTQVPWFYSANHCFDDASFSRTASQMQAIANTLNTFWFYESAACGGTTLSSSMVQRVGGATYLYSDGPSDVLFLRLNDAPPAGSWYSGWNPATVPAGLELVAIHHPQGDLKKVSVGNSRCHGAPSPDFTSGGFVELHWTQGTTEPGSSGSGIWNFDNGEYFFRGGLQGGFASCTALASPDFYSRFDLAYSHISQYLSPGTAPDVSASVACTPGTNFTDLWWNSSQSGWGLKLIQHVSNNIFGVWYTYGSDSYPLWVVMPGGKWSSSVEFTGKLYTTSGPAYSSAFDPALVKVKEVGTGTVTFTGTGTGFWSYTVNGLSGSRAITRQPY